MVKKFLAFADKHSMLPRGRTVIAAVSGGADSMCLLHAVKIIAAERGINLISAHYNHNLRGAEAERDENFVLEYCRSHGIPCHVGSGDVPAYAAKNKLGTEEAAREMRYAFLEELAWQTSAYSVLTAHTADDNAETLIMNLARGAGTRGLSAIPPVRGIFMRPMLEITRAEVEQYLAENEVPHVEDSTNHEDIYTRNHVRHNIIPLFRELNPNFASAVSAAAELARQDDEYLSAVADEIVEKEFKNSRISVKVLNALSPAIAARIVRIVCGRLTAVQTESVLALARAKNPSASVSVTGMTVRREYDYLVFGAEEEITFAAREIIPGGSVHIPELGLKIACEVTENGAKVHKTLNSLIFNYEHVCGRMFIRPRMTGDSIRLQHSGISKSLKKLFIEKKIPKSKRATVPVIADDNGVLAVFGIGIDERVASGDEKGILKIMFEEIGND